MKRVFIVVRFIEVAILVFGCNSAVIAQVEKENLSGDKTASRSGFTGAGEGGNSSTAAKPGRADGLGNPLLGGECRPLYRLHPSDVVEVTFTVAPEFNQTLTVQPDGYVTLKDAGAVPAQGLTIPQFAEAVRKAYAGYLHDPEVAVALKDFERPYFVVGGEVGKPGSTNCGPTLQSLKLCRLPAVSHHKRSIRRWCCSGGSMMSWLKPGCSTSKRC